MIVKSLTCIVCAFTALVSFNASAAIINTLNGINYEWVELTETEGLSRVQVEAMLSDSNSALFGYEYASRSLIEDLFLSYSTWDGLSGWHSADAVVTGVTSLINDFGIIRSFPGDGVSHGVVTIDENKTVQVDAFIQSRGLYGTKHQCTFNTSCFANLETYFDLEGNAVMTDQVGSSGWNANSLVLSTIPDDETPLWAGSFLVREAAVPIPPALYLFGSGLIGLVGLARRKAT